MHEAPTVSLEDLSPAARRERRRQTSELEAAFASISPPPPTASPVPPPVAPAMVAADLPLVMTADEVAELLRIERRLIYGLVSRGELPGAIRLGRALRFNRDSVLGWLARDGQSRGKKRKP